MYKNCNRKCIIFASAPESKGLSACLRLGSGPAQPATRLLARPVSPAHPVSGPSLPDTGLAQPATTPSHPASPAQPAQPWSAQPRSPAAQAAQPKLARSTSCSRLAPSHPAGPAPSAQRLVSKYASPRLASGPVPQPACWRVFPFPFPLCVLGLIKSVPIKTQQEREKGSVSIHLLSFLYPAFGTAWTQERSE